MSARVSVNLKTCCLLILCNKTHDDDDDDDDDDETIEDICFLVGSYKPMYRLEKKSRATSHFKITGQGQGHFSEGSLSQWVRL